MRHRFPGLLRDTTAAGTLRWRVRKEGEPNKKIPIPCGPGEPGFHEHYYAARAGEKLEIIKPKAPKKGTLDELCDRFLAWMEGRVASGDLSPLTLSSRRTGLKQAREVLDPDGDRMGALDADLPSEAFVHILDTFGGRSGAAHTCLKALRAAYTWGEDRGFPKNSPRLSGEIRIQARRWGNAMVRRGRGAIPEPASGRLYGQALVLPCLRHRRPDR